MTKEYTEERLDFLELRTKKGFILSSSEILELINEVRENLSGKIKNGVELIAEERKRQIQEEGFMKGYCADILALAGVAYAFPEERRECGAVSKVPYIWPFSNTQWKPTPNDRKRELVKAGALIAAAIDRLEGK